MTAAFVTTPQPGQMLGVTRPDGTHLYPLVDGLGSVTALTDSAGAVVGRYEYDAYGSQVQAPTGAGTEVYTFAGQQYDAATGLYSMRSRYYDPTHGRFISADPVAASNQYWYAEADPVDMVDVFGETSSVESLSFGKPEKYEQCAIEPYEICIGETPEMIAQVRPRHRRDLVDHDLAWLVDPGGSRRLQGDPSQRRLDGIGCQRTDRDRGGCIEAIVLNDDDGSRLAGIGTACRSDVDLASPHSAVQSTEMASTNPWSSASCSLAAMAADWRWASATNSGARTSGTQI